MSLRLGYWTDDPYRGKLLAFWRVPEVRRALRQHLGRAADPRPRTVLYAPGVRRTLGWVAWEAISAI